MIEKKADYGIPNWVFVGLAGGFFGSALGLMGMCVSLIWDQHDAYRVAGSLAAICGLCFAFAFVAGLVLANGEDQPKGTRNG